MTLPKPPFYFKDSKYRYYLAYAILPDYNWRVCSMNEEGTNGHMDEDVQEILSPGDPRISPEMHALREKFAVANGWEPLFDTPIECGDFVYIIGESSNFTDNKYIGQHGTVYMLSKTEAQVIIHGHCIRTYPLTSLKKVGAEPLAPKAAEATSSKTERIPDRISRNDAWYEIAKELFVKGTTAEKSIHIARAFCDALAEAGCWKGDGDE